MGFRDSDYKKIHESGLTNKQIMSLADNSICVPVLEHLFANIFDQYPDIMPEL